VAGVKVTASKKVIGNYLKAASHFKEPGRFGIYVGSARLVFDLFRPHRGLLGRLKERWDRFWVRRLPQGIVSGPANVFPKAWKQAWLACVAGDGARMEAYRAAFDQFSDLCVFGGQKKAIACLKEALRIQGVIECGRVAAGTPPLDEAERAEFDRRYREFTARHATIL
jgi:hypothetical protein